MKTALKALAAVALLALGACEPPPGEEIALSRQPDGRYRLKTSSLSRALAAGGLYHPFWPDTGSPLKPDIDYADGNFRSGLERLEPVPGRKPRRFEIRTNSHGFRTQPFDWKKPPGSFRVAAFGDSTVFGLPVAAGETFLAVAGRELSQRYPDKRIELLDLGVPGFTLTKIRKLYNGLPELEADAVLFGSAFNDYGIGPHPDRSPLEDPLPVPEHRWAVLPPGSAAALPEFSRLDDTWRTMGVWKWPAHRGRQHFADEIAVLVQGIRQRGQLPLVVDLEQSRRYYRPVFERMSEELSVPVLHTPELILDAALSAAAKRDPFVPGCPFEPALPAGGALKLRLRMTHAPGYRSPDGYSVMIQRLGSDVLKSGPSAPWLVPPVTLNDSGADGDEKAGDGIFTRMFDIPLNETVRFYFLPGSGVALTDEMIVGAEAWPARFLHTFPADLARYHRSCDPAEIYTTPVFEYGRWDLMEEPVHPDTEGHAVIGHALAELIDSLPAFKAFTGRGE